MKPYRYLHLDVFTDVPFGGNQLAVFPEPAGLDTELMQSITREMNYSESTFVFPPEDTRPSTTARPSTQLGTTLSLSKGRDVLSRAEGNDVEGRTAVRVRIFTPGKELPMAGHPTIGTAFALAHDGVIPAGQPEVVFGLGVGPTRVRLQWAGKSLAFAEMEQLLPEFGEPVRDRAAVAAALNLNPQDIPSGTPMQPISCGVPFLFVPLVTREAVDRAVVDAAAFSRLCRAHGLAEEVFIFSQEAAADGATVYSRMFAPGVGVTEDPATGSASGPLGCYLVRYGLVAKEKAGQIVSLQGVKMHRPSRVHIAIGVDGDTITSVRVGGRAVVVGEGVLRW